MLREHINRPFIEPEEVLCLTATIFTSRWVEVDYKAHFQLLQVTGPTRDLALERGQGLNAIRELGRIYDRYRRSKLMLLDNGSSGEESDNIV
jgi:hypothetical protein